MQPAWALTRRVFRKLPGLSFGMLRTNVFGMLRTNVSGWGPFAASLSPHEFADLIES